KLPCPGFFHPVSKQFQTTHHVPSYQEESDNAADKKQRHNYTNCILRNADDTFHMAPYISVLFFGITENILAGFPQCLNLGIQSSEPIDQLMAGRPKRNIFQKFRCLQRMLAKCQLNERIIAAELSV